MKMSWDNNIGTMESSLVAWWLGFWAFTAVARVQSLVRELRSHEPRGILKKKKIYIYIYIHIYIYVFLYKMYYALAN